MIFFLSVLLIVRCKCVGGQSIGVLFLQGFFQHPERVLVDKVGNELFRGLSRLGSLRFQEFKDAGGKGQSDLMLFRLHDNTIIYTLRIYATLKYILCIYYISTLAIFRAAWYCPPHGKGRYKAMAQGHREES